MQTAILLEKSGAIINLRKCSGRIISTEILILKSVLIATITNHAGGHHGVAVRSFLQIDEVDLPLNTNVDRV